MTGVSLSIVYLPGGGGGCPAYWSAFKTSEADSRRFEAIKYPRWQDFVAEGFSPEVLISELVAQIMERTPDGRILLIGCSIGGHFGYAAALRLQALGRDIAGFCIVDSFMIASSEPGADWKKRHLQEGLGLLRQRRFRELAGFLRTRFWRAQLRLLGDKLPRLLQRLNRSGHQPAFAALDPTLEEELNMRLLIRAAAPWIASLDRDPVALRVPAALLRTGQTAGDDPAWRRRCPAVEIFEIKGGHHTYLEPENVSSFHAAFAAATRNWHLGLDMGDSHA